VDLGADRYCTLLGFIRIGSKLPPLICLMSGLLPVPWTPT